ncbi:hypothetical protein M0R72_13255 [Candidatus Pacearchaeota archaeon]|jgi:hypothetical protein|nr:hypothetical protein [Candidatus Pacearchaeota archaeon]
MVETKLIDKVRQFLAPIQGRDIDLMQLRRDLNIDPASPAWDGLRMILLRLSEGENPLIRPTGRKDGSYRVITQVKPVRVFAPGRERRQPYMLIFPKEKATGLEMWFADQITIREGDFIFIAGVSNFGKTLLALEFCAQNIDKKPVLMGNEYTTWNSEKQEFEPHSRFLNRLDKMDWVKWVDDEGMDKFTLLPVRDDYASHVVKDRINIIDWVNLKEHYDIGHVCEEIKKASGRGISIVVEQKGEGASAGRGGQFTKDFTDVEILLDPFGKDEILLTLGKVKEPKPGVRLYGKTYAYSIWDGVEIRNFREVVTCPQCKGKSVTAGKCDKCNSKGKVDA